MEDQPDLDSKNLISSFCVQDDFPALKPWTKNPIDFNVIDDR